MQGRIHPIKFSDFRVEFKKIGVEKKVLVLYFWNLTLKELKMSESTLRVPLWIHRFFIPIFLIVLCPPTVFVFWYINTALGGSFQAFWSLIYQNGLFTTMKSIWGPLFFGSPLAWKILASYAAFQLLLMKIVPGKPFLGPITPQGNIPIYKANGVPCFLITVGLYLLSSYGLHLFSPTIIYDNLGAMLGALNIFSLLFCLFLYLKGIFSPSSSDSAVRATSSLITIGERSFIPAFWAGISKCSPIAALA